MTSVLNLTLLLSYGFISIPLSYLIARIIAPYLRRRSAHSCSSLAIGANKPTSHTVPRCRRRDGDTIRIQCRQIEGRELRRRDHGKFWVGTGVGIFETSPPGLAVSRWQAPLRVAIESRWGEPRIKFFEVSWSPGVCYSNVVCSGILTFVTSTRR